MKRYETMTAVALFSRIGPRFNSQKHFFMVMLNHLDILQPVDTNRKTKMYAYPGTGSAPLFYVQG